MLGESHTWILSIHFYSTIFFHAIRVIFERDHELCPETFFNHNLYLFLVLVCGIFQNFNCTMDSILKIHIYLSRLNLWNSLYFGHEFTISNWLIQWIRLLFLLKVKSSQAFKMQLIIQSLSGLFSCCFNCWTKRYTGTRGYSYGHIFST